MWGKYEYQKLRMGVCNSPDIFQENISEIFKGFDMVPEYIDDILLVSKNDFKNHLNTIERVLQIISEAVLEFNAEK